MSAPEITSRTIGDLDADTFAYHVKVQERLTSMLRQSQEKLETCTEAELADHQAIVQVVRIMIKLPDTILQEERNKRAKL